MVAESLMAAAEEWAGTPEQADDMTVIVGAASVVRLRRLKLY